MKVYTLGYMGWRYKDLREVIERLDATIIDVRLKPRSRIKCYAAPALRQGMPEGRYVWMGDRFGNVNYKSGPIKLKDFEGGMVELANMIAPGSQSIILMCGCSDVNVCHRKDVAERIAAAWHCEVEHLPRPKRPSMLDHQAGKLFE